MAGMKDIKSRIKSVENTMQITSAMKLVASSKLRKAKERAENARPFFNTIYQTMSQIAMEATDFQSDFLEQKEVKKSLYIVISGDRGLAGGYNSNVLKYAVSHMGDKDCDVLPIGKKSVDFFQKSKYNIVQEFENISEDITLYTASKIAKIAVEKFKDKTYQEVVMIFTNFVSSLSQEPNAIKILPVPKLDSQDKKVGVATYEPSAGVVFDNIIPQYVSGIIYGGVVESFASEQGARRTAMESATDNAQEMIESLSLKYNRARQAAITQEITEIVGGAVAL